MATQFTYAYANDSFHPGTISNDFVIMNDPDKRLFIGPSNADNYLIVGPTETVVKGDFTVEGAHPKLDAVSNQAFSAIAADLDSLSNEVFMAIAGDLDALSNDFYVEISNVSNQAYVSLPNDLDTLSNQVFVAIGGDLDTLSNDFYVEISNVSNQAYVSLPNDLDSLSNQVFVAIGSDLDSLSNQVFVAIGGDLDNLSNDIYSSAVAFVERDEPSVYGSWSLYFGSNPQCNQVMVKDVYELDAMSNFLLDETLKVTSNLSDVASRAEARSNLELGGHNAVVFSELTVSNGLVVASNIMPTTNATLDIGSSNMRFKEAWIDTLYLSSNTLYLGDTPVLGTDQDTVNVSASDGQGINIKTSGTGETSLTSVKGVNVAVSGLNSLVDIQSSGSGGRVQMGAVAEVTMTAPTTTVSSNLTVQGNVTVQGDLTVNGSNVVVNVQTVEVEDNIILLNRGQVGSGVTAGIAGIAIDRGDGPDYQILFDESDDKLKAGFSGGLAALATETALSNLSNAVNTKTNAISNQAYVTVPASVSTLSNAVNTKTNAISNQAYVTVPASVSTLSNAFNTKTNAISNQAYVTVPASVSTLSNAVNTKTNAISNQAYVTVPASVSTLSNAVHTKTNAISNQAYVTVPANVSNLSNAILSDALVAIKAIAAQDGSALLPAYTFANDLSSNTGMYRIAEDQIGFSTGGANRVTISSTGIAGAGSGLTALNAANISSGTLAVARGGTGVTTSTGTGSTVLNSNPTIQGATFSGDVKFNTGVNLFVNGSDSAAAPGYSWDGDSNTGMYRIAEDQIGFATGGANRVTISSTGIAGAGSGLTGLSAANITGTLAATSIPTLDASKINGGVLTNVQLGGSVTFGSNSWFNSSEGNNRLYFANASHTYVKAFSNIIFRPNNSAGDIGGITSSTGFYGSGSGLTALNAANISSGTLAVARGGTGVTTGLTALNAANITSGTLAVARGGTGVTVSTGTGCNVLNTNPTIAGATFSGDVKFNSGVNLFVNGSDSAGAPGYSWDGDSNTGMYRITTGQIGFATGGANRVTISSTGIAGAGSGLTALNAANVSSGTLAVARGGTGVTTSTGTGSTVLNTNPTIAGATFSGDVKFNSGVNLFVNGSDSAAAPGYSWDGDSNTGMYRITTGQIGFATGGANRVTISSTGIAGAGSGLTGLSAANVSSGTLAVARGGTGVTTSTGTGSTVLNTNPTIAGATFSGDVKFNSGVNLFVNGSDSAAAPGYSWDGDSNTGMYRVTADQIGFSTGGVERFRITNTDSSFYVSNLSIGTTTATVRRWANAAAEEGLFYNSAVYHVFTTGTNPNPATAPQSLIMSPSSALFKNNASFYVYGYFVSWSDDRIKSSETIISNATDSLLKLRPQLYDKWDRLNYETDSNATFGKEAGLVAQEMWYGAPELRHLVVVPEGADSNAIYTQPLPLSDDPSVDPDYSAWGSNIAAVNYIGLIPYLVKAIQEKDADIQELKARVAALEATG